MDNSHIPFRYRLGIDVGVASLGIAIISLDEESGLGSEGQGFYIEHGTVRIYPLPLGASDRRVKRAMRRNIERKARRLDRLSDVLAEKGIGYLRKEATKDILNLSPIKLRAQASREKIPLNHFARALLHMAQHRGSSAIRESSIKDDNEARQTAEGIKTLRSEMSKRGFTTYGQYLRWREKANLPTRINPNNDKMLTEKGNYVFYPSREILCEEFDIIWCKQAAFYPDKLTSELRMEVEDELFFQRAVTSPPPGKCPYTPSETRLAKASRLFQIRRIYEESNHLRFSGKNGEPIAYDINQRDLIVERLMSGEDLTFAEIKKALGLQRTDKISIEDSKARNGIAGYPFDRDLGTEDVLGARWHDANETTKDHILDIISTQHDDEKAIQSLAEILNGDREAAKQVLETSMPSGWGRMGQTATERILHELKKEVIPARIAEDRAGLVHVATPDGQIFNRLPYYGEILVGHTVPPMWVSDYRRDTDRPPHTDPNEEKFGRIPNPVVHLALNQIRQTINAVIDKYGLPETIHIELARDLNKSAEAREQIEKQNDRNKKDSDAAVEELRKHKISVNRANIQKYKLWKEQGGICVYTGDPISLKELYSGNIDVDHILPRSITFSDSMANKLVCFKRANAEKNNRAPYQAFANRHGYDWSAIMRKVEKLHDNKKWRFEATAMERFADESEFRARYGTDNSYIARVARQYLSALYGDPSKVIAVSSHIVALLRAKWGLQDILGSKESGKKARDDHRHHFIDALVTACATRGMVQRIMTEAARCERKGLEAFVETIAPPFGTPREFVAAVKDAVETRVSLSRKPDHSPAGQLHEDSLRGIVDGPDKKGSYVCRVRKSLRDYSTLSALQKPAILSTLPDLDEINQARSNLENIKVSIAGYCAEATQQLVAEREADIASGKKGKTVSDQAVFARAVKLHKDAGGPASFTLYENKKLVNVRRAKGGTRVTGGYISGRNHRIEIYADSNGKIKWQCISMLEANDPKFVPEASKASNSLIWAAHKEDTLEINDPDAPECADRRIRVVVVKFKDSKLGVVPVMDARAANDRKKWENGLSFFCQHGAQRIVTDPLGDIKWRFPMLPRTGKLAPGE